MGQGNTWCSVVVHVCERDLWPSLSLKPWAKANSGSPPIPEGRLPTVEIHTPPSPPLFICSISVLLFLLSSFNPSLFSPIHSFFVLFLICFICFSLDEEHLPKSMILNRLPPKWLLWMYSGPKRIWSLKPTKIFVSLQYTYILFYFNYGLCIICFRVQISFMCLCWFIWLNKHYSIKSFNKKAVEKYQTINVMFMNTNKKNLWHFPVVKFCVTLIQWTLVVILLAAVFT